MSLFALLVADTGWHMDMDGGWWVVMVVGIAFFWAVTILGAAWLVRELVVRRREHSPAPLELLDRRLAEGGDLTLRHADLESLALIRADLRGADFTGTDLTEAILTGAKTTPGFTTGAILCNTSMPDGTIANPQAKC